MRNLLKQSGLYLAAPSANKSGGISPTTAEHVRRSLGGEAPLVLDGGTCENGIESTIVALRGDDYQILRPGPITDEDLVRVAGRKPIPEKADRIEAPGQLASHYAPSKPVRLEVTNCVDDEFHIGFAAVAGDFNLSEHGDLAEAASRLFAALHIADASERKKIAIASIPRDGIGRALNDRVQRAATPK